MITEERLSEGVAPGLHPHHPAVGQIVRRAVGVVGLATVALVHLIDAPSKFSETPYLGWGYVLLIAGTLVSAALIAERDDRRAWIAAGALCAGAIVMFVLSRTTGLPAAKEDIGNWTEPLGMAALFAEAAVVWFALRALRGAPALRLVHDAQRLVGGTRQRPRPDQLEADRHAE